MKHKYRKSVLTLLDFYKPIIALRNDGIIQDIEIGLGTLKFHTFKLTSNKKSAWFKNV